MSAERVAVVLGARGTLGSALVDLLPRSGFRLAAAPSHAECDIRDASSVRAACAGVRPDVIFNAAAYTDVDRAEQEPEVAHAANALGPENIGRVAVELGAAVVHYSTDFVFDGELERPYVETDPPSPLGAYARTKVEGDQRLAAANPRHFILRVGCLYGQGGRNFPSTIVRRLKAGEQIRADDERRASPTWVREVAAVSAALARTEHHGVFHATAQGETTWAEFARQCAALLGLSQDRVHGVPTASLTLKAQRPRRAILDNAHLRRLGLDGFSPWERALAAFVSEQAQVA